MTNRNNTNMIVYPTFAKEIQNVIQTLKDGSAGWDAISSRVIKLTYSSFITPLTHIMNLSLLKGVFPSELKIAKVIPLFKSGDSMSFSNYRPVSVLPLFSKILERLMYSRLLSFINENKTLYKFQFGFREGHSPDLALIYLVDKISNALENGDFVLGLFLDFSKAFDTVDHNILFDKLEFLGIRGTTLSWFQSYLNTRKQYVEYNSVKSTEMTISCGVPQGSILGPLLFLLYINDLADVSDKLFALLFADDSNMFLSGKNPDELIESMNIEIEKVICWLRTNKLSLNLKKTHYIIFHRRRAKPLFRNAMVIDNVTIERTTHTKFLGVIIDEYLTFSRHIQFIKGKISRALGILYKCKKYFNWPTLLTLYNTFISPYYSYCNTVWGGTFPTYLEPLLKLQKRAVRMIMGADRLAHSDPLFRKLGILSVKKIHIYSCQLVLFKFEAELLPNIFDGFFIRNDTIHNHFTRQRSLLHVPCQRTSITAKNLRSFGVYTYNYFSPLICMDRSYLSYKKELKDYILKHDVSFR